MDDTGMGGGEVRGALGGPPRDTCDRDGDGQHQHEDAKEVVCRDERVKIIAIADTRTSSSEVIPRWAKMPVFKGSISWTTPPVELLRTRPSWTTL